MLLCRPINICSYTMQSELVFICFITSSEKQCGDRQAKMEPLVYIDAGSGEEAAQGRSIHAPGTRQDATFLCHLGWMNSTISVVHRQKVS